MTKKVHVIECDVMLLGWSETHSGGAKVTLQLSDVAELEPFKSMTIKKGKIAGQLLKACFVEVDGNGEPVQPDEPAKKGGGKFPGGLCGLAVRWCGETHFIEWIMDTYPHIHADALQSMMCGESTPINDVSAWCVKKICGIGSRKELDTNDLARARFEELIRVPYAAHRKELGLE